MLRIAISIIILASGCASSPEARPRVIQCLADPRNNSMHCDGQTYPWGDKFIGYVCHRLDEE